MGRFPISSMRKCDVETMSYRKSSPAHPTLVVHFESPLRADNQPPPVKAPKKSEKKLRAGRASIKKAAIAAAASAEHVISPAATTHTSLGTRSQASSPFPRSSAPKTITEAVLFRSPVEGIDAILDWHDTLRPHLMSVITAAPFQYSANTDTTIGLPGLTHLSVIERSCLGHTTATSRPRVARRPPKCSVQPPPLDPPSPRPIPTPRRAKSFR